MAYKSICEIQKALLGKELHLSELVKNYISDAESKDTEINAFTSFQFEQALNQAELIQKKIESNQAGKLAGAVFGIKEAICQEGEIANCGSKMLQNFKSVYDATVIEHLKKEDAIILGRVNMDEFAMGSSTTTSAFGATRNPHDLSKVPGGSSGGSAAALAANMVNASLGSDTGGSIRQPASFCGVVGVKPTYGRVSRHGLVAYASSFDCIGPLTHTVADSALILNAISGVDKRDATTSDIPVADYLTQVENPVSGIRIGIPEEYFGEGLHPEVKEKVMSVLSELEKQGATLVPITLPHLKYAIGTYYILATAEASSNLARFDGIRYGHRADFKRIKEELSKEEKAIKKSFAAAEANDKSGLIEALAAVDSPLIRLYKESRAEGFGAEVKRRIMLGTYVLSAGYYDAYYGKAQRVRRLIKQDFSEAFSKVDVIASPTAPTTAFGLDENQDDPIQMYLNDIYTISANLAGICAVSVPAGTDKNGLPIGLQFMADSFQEEKLFNAASLSEKQFS